MRKILPGLWILKLSLLASVPSAFAMEEAKLGVSEFKFHAKVNVGAFDIKGDVNQLDGKAELDKNQIKKISMKIPISALTTHIGLRDKHMREKIFTNPKNEAPPILFDSESVECKPKDAKDTQKLNCKVVGSLTIRGVSKPHTLVSEVKTNAKGRPESAEFKSAVKLSAYEIQSPSYMGVKVNDEVTFMGHLLIQ